MKSFFEVLRTLLILGRVSNLPTVWSNLLAGWFIAGGDPFYFTQAPLLLGGSFLYIGGMYLNDFCDAEFDARYCKERPIPAGKISRRLVGVLAGFWFISGLVCLAPFGVVTEGIALLLLAAIVLYNFRHKDVAWAPLVMGICRLLLYPLAASAVVGQGILMATLGHHINDLRFLNELGLIISLAMVPVGIPLGLYVAGITYLARGESRPGKPTRWALLLLLLPITAAFGIYAAWNYSAHPVPLTPILLICLLQLCWMAWLLVPLWRKTNPSIGRVVSGLLAGIVLVDMILVMALVGPLSVVLFPLFAIALLLQRVIPAT